MLPEQFSSSVCSCVLSLFVPCFQPDVITGSVTRIIGVVIHKEVIILKSRVCRVIIVIKSLRVAQREFS